MISVYKNILINRYIRKLNIALIKHIAHLRHGVAGAHVINLVELVVNKDGGIVRRIHVKALT